jgi:bacterial/archaeal transporter family protein
MPLWVVASLISAFLWGIWGFAFAAASKEMTPLMVQVFVTLGCAPVALRLFLTPTVWRGTSIPRGIAWATGTGIGGTVGTIAVSQAFVLGGEASVITPLTAMYPGVTVLLAYLFLRERVTPIQGIGIVLALGTILLFSSVEPSGGEISLAGSLASPWMWSGLLALILFGIQGITQKKSVLYISNELATICYWVVGIIASLVIVLTQPFDWSSLSPVAWAAVLGAGVVFGIASWVGLAAYRVGQAAIVTALIALYPIVTVVLAVPFLGEAMTPLKATAVVLAIIAGTALSYEKQTRTAYPLPSEGSVS